MADSKNVDPAVLASIRWCANFVEMVALEAYMGKRDNAEQIRKTFVDTVNALRVLHSKADCDPPWQWCADSKCEPICYDDKSNVYY